jgi:L-erythro-3,5-diaminohexanoate dehydrogenase
MLIGNGYVPGHAAFALDLIRAEPGARQIFESRTAEG